ncbi:MAG: hypothetical protein RIR91_949 [Verrucomicrobiota bacterium]
MSTLRVITAATTEPLSLAEARDHLRVDHFEDDGVISGCILAARQHIENITGLALAASTWLLTMDATPEDGWVLLPREPVQSVTSVQYYNTAGTLTTWASTEWEVDLYSSPPRLRAKYGSTWPTVKDVLAAVQVTFVCGYSGPQTVPQPILQALRLLVGHYYENREAATAGSISAMPFAVDALLAPYKTAWV